MDHLHFIDHLRQSTFSCYFKAECIHLDYKFGAQGQTIGWQPRKHLALRNLHLYWWRPIIPLSTQKLTRNPRGSVHSGMPWPAARTMMMSSVRSSSTAVLARRYQSHSCSTSPLHFSCAAATSRNAPGSRTRLTPRRSCTRWWSPCGCGTGQISWNEHNLACHLNWQASST